MPPAAGQPLDGCLSAPDDAAPSGHLGWPCSEVPGERGMVQWSSPHGRPRLWGDDILFRPSNRCAECVKRVPLQTHGGDVEPAWGGGRLPGGLGLSLEGGGDREKESSGFVATGEPAGRAWDGSGAGEVSRHVWGLAVGLGQGARAGRRPGIGTVCPRRRSP